jgi:hypothetical protein
MWWHQPEGGFTEWRIKISPRAQGERLCYLHKTVLGSHHTTMGYDPAQQINQHSSQAKHAVLCTLAASTITVATAKG